MPQIHRARVVFPEIPQASVDYPITCTLRGGFGRESVTVSLFRVYDPAGKEWVKVVGHYGELEYSSTMPPTASYDCAVASGFGHYFVEKLRTRYDGNPAVSDALLSEDIREWVEHPIDSEGSPILQRGNIYLRCSYDAPGKSILHIDVRRKDAFELRHKIEHTGSRIRRRGVYRYLVHVMGQLQGLNFGPMDDSEFRRFVNDCDASYHPDYHE